MNEGDKQPDLQPALGFAHDVPPVPHVAMSAGPQPHHTSLPVSDKAWLGVTSLSVGIAGLAIGAIVSVVAGTWAFFIVPVVVFVTGIVAIVLGHLGFSDAKRKSSAMGPSVAGMIVGYILAAFFIVMLAILGFFFLVILNWSSGV